MHLLRPALLAVVALLVVAPAAAPAATWTAPQEIAELTIGTSLGLGVAPDGSAAVAWTGGSGFNPANRPVLAVTRSGRDGAWSPTVTVGDTGSAGFALPTLATAGSKDATVGWGHGGGFAVATRPVGGAFGPRQDIADRGAGYIQSSGLRRAANGDELAFWVATAPNNGGGRLMVADRSAGGAFGSAVQVSPTGAAVGFANVQVNEAGRAVALWGTFDAPVQVAVRDLGQPWGAPTTLGTGTPDGLGVSDAGDAVAVWEARGETYATALAGASWGTSQDVGAGSAPTLAVAANGDALLMWIGEGSRLRLARRPAGGSFAVMSGGPVACLASQPKAVVDGAGNALVSWQSVAASGGISIAGLLVGPDGSLRQLDGVDAGAGQAPGVLWAGLLDVPLALDGDGYVTAVWPNVKIGPSPPGHVLAVQTTAPIAALAAAAPAYEPPSDCPPYTGELPPSLPPLPARTAPALRLVASKPLRVRGGRLGVPVRCPVSDGRRCVGTLTVRVGSRSVGSAAFSYAAGTRGLWVPVKLAKRTTRVTLEAQTTLVDGASTRTRRTVRVQPRR